MTTDEILRGLPNRGWAVVRAPAVLVVALHSAGLIRAQYTAMPDVFQARLTGEGRKRLTTSPRS